MVTNMNLKTKPLVSVVTPVYNGENYLAECIESILAQAYENWEYIIVNNCSNDNSLKIAQSYAKNDPRIRIYDNEEFLPLVQNFNYSLLQISAHSKYCKVIHADDWLFPRCIAEMVDLAERNPSVGIIGSYALQGVRVAFDGLPYPSSVVMGHEICRMTLMNKSPGGGGFYVFGSPSTLLIRSDLIRGRNPFYNDRYFQVVDEEACYYLLQNVDFGFIHQVLSSSRLHPESITSSSIKFNRLIMEELMLLIEYGPVYLSDNEFGKRLGERIDMYYRFLAQEAFKRRYKEFRNFHKEGLERLELPLHSSRLITSILREFVRKLIRRLLHPKTHAQDVIRQLKKGKI